VLGRTHTVFSGQFNKQGTEFGKPVVENVLVRLEPMLRSEILVTCRDRANSGRDHCTFQRYLAATAEVPYEYPLIIVEKHALLVLDRTPSPGHDPKGKGDKEGSGKNEE